MSGNQLKLKTSETIMTHSLRKLITITGIAVLAAFFFELLVDGANANRAES